MICADVLAESQELAQVIESCALKVVLVTRLASQSTRTCRLHMGHGADVHDAYRQIKVAMLVAWPRLSSPETESCA